MFYFQFEVLVHTIAWGYILRTVLYYSPYLFSAWKWYSAEPIEAKISLWSMPSIQPTSFFRLLTYICMYLLGGTEIASRSFSPGSGGWEELTPLISMPTASHPSQSGWKWYEQGVYWARLQHALRRWHLTSGPWDLHEYKTFVHFSLLFYVYDLLTFFKLPLAKTSAYAPFLDPIQCSYDANVNPL